MEINNLRELGSYGTLREGDIINFRGKKDGFELWLEYRVMYLRGHGFYLRNNTEIANDQIFKALNINKHNFCKKSYGYSTSSEDDFPVTKVKDCEAIIRVVRDLYVVLDGIVEIEEIDRFSLMDLD